MKRLLALAATLAIGACADPTSPPADRTTVSHGQAVLSAPANGPQASGLTVMTWNVYYGTDPMPVLLAPPESVPFVAARAWALARQTDFPERAGAIARAIAVRRPHLIGLQEAALWRIQSPGDLVLGGDVPATTVVYDFVNSCSILSKPVDWTTGWPRATPRQMSRCPCSIRRTVLICPSTMSA